MKKFLIILAIMSLLVCALVISVSAATPELYITFQVKLAGDSDLTTVYVENPEAGDPRVNLTFDFYTDLDFTQKVDKSQITMLDFSNAVHSNPKMDYVDRFTTADPSLFPLCEEVKWFTRVYSKPENSIFNNWTQLKRFDFGCITEVNYNFLSNTGLEEVVLPEAITTLKNSVFSGCKSLKSVVIKGGLTSLGSGIFQNCTALETVDLGSTAKVTDSMFKSCTSLKTVYNANSIRQEGAVFIPEGVTSIGQCAFQDCKSIKYLSLPTTFNYAGQNIFSGCSALEFIDFNGNTNDINFYNCSHFQSCTSLKAVSLPDNTTVLSNRILNSCSALKAVYLPANLQKMNTNGNGQGPFCYSSSMYFVQEPFEVRGEDGYFLGDDFVMPEKPEVYYMPYTLAEAGGNVHSGTWFRECKGLNTTIVMPVAFTDSTVVQMFRDTASSTTPKNVIYLGDMETIAWSERNHNINFVFANPNDTDITSVEFISFYNKNNSDCYFYFCSTGKKYTMAKASVDEVAGTLEENSYHHVKKESKTTEATCTLPAMTGDFCFCGQPFGAVTELAPALGHSYTGAVNYVIPSLTEAVTKCTVCVNNCGIDKEETLAPVYTELGYSVMGFGDSGYSFTNGYNVNLEALNAYEAQNGVTIKFGFGFNAANSFATEGEVTLESFKYTTYPADQSNGVKFSMHEFKLNYADNTHLADDIVIAAYVLEVKGENETLSFINRGQGAANGFETINYNQALEKAE